ncbi:hypothetical protein H0H92_004556 [Tricholoma furcatifolium]|nr:hypothetical protein H0H92_004556 [Tricholoma furcatifolium]
MDQPQRSHTITVKVPAHYVWLLVFDYDNTGNEGTLTHEYVRTQTITYDRNTVEELLAEETQKINNSTSVNGDAGFTLGKLPGCEYIGDETKETATTTSEHVPHLPSHSELNFEIVPKSRTCLYQRAFMNKGISIKTDQFRTTNKPLSDAELFEESSVTYSTCRWLEGVWGPATSKSINRFELQQVAMMTSTYKNSYLEDEKSLDNRSHINSYKNHFLVGRDLREMSPPPGMSPSIYVTHYYLVPYKERGNDEVISKVYLSNEGPTKDSPKSLKFLNLSDRVYDKGWTERPKWLVWEVSQIGTGIVSE